jgi:hypothetical protein
VRKLVRRLGPEVINEICRVVIAGATTGERRFVARAARIDSTVVEADVRYLTDIGLAADATTALARAAGAVVGADTPRVRNARGRSSGASANSTGRWRPAPARASRSRCG